MSAMDDLYAEWTGRFIDRIVLETGYDWDYVYTEWCEAIHRGVKPIDFFDDMVDSIFNLE